MSLTSELTPSFESTSPPPRVPTLITGEEVTAEELLARAESNGYKTRGPPGRRPQPSHAEARCQDQEGPRFGVGLLCAVSDSRLQANNGANVVEYRWVLSEMTQEPIQSGLQIPDEGVMGNVRCSGEGNRRDVQTFRQTDCREVDDCAVKTLE